MNKNILLVNISVVNPGNIKTENTYKYENGTQSFECKGIQTNEAVTKLILSQLKEKSEKLNCIYLIVSDTANKEVHFEFPDGKKRSHKEFYLEQIEKYCADNQMAEVWDRDNTKEFPIEDAPNNMSLIQSSIQITEELYQLKQTLQKEKGEVHLYIDSNGGLRDFMTVLTGTIQLLKLRDFYVHSIWGVNFGPDKKLIANKTKAYMIFDLISGIDEYTGYGRAKRLNQFFSKSETCRDQGILEVINSLAEHMQLCHPAKIRKELGQLKKLSKKYISSGKVSDGSYALWNFVLKEILEDYGELILERNGAEGLKSMEFKKNSATVLELIQWCIRKEFLQQALTLFDSKMPSMIVSEGNGEQKKKPIIVDSKIKEDVEKRYKVGRGEDWQYALLIRYLRYDNGYETYCSRSGNHVVYPPRHSRRLCQLVDFVSENPSDPIYCNCGQEELQEILSLYQSIKDERNGVNHASNKNGRSDEPRNKSEVEALLTNVVTKLKNLGIR